MEEKVKKIMILPLIHVRDMEYCPETRGSAAGGRNFHLLEMSGDGLEGILTNHYPKQFLCVSPLSFSRNSEINRFIEGLGCAIRDGMGLMGLPFRNENRSGRTAGMTAWTTGRSVRTGSRTGLKAIWTTNSPCCWVASE
jgi:hypothetical protein